MKRLRLRLTGDMVSGYCDREGIRPMTQPKLRHALPMILDKRLCEPFVVTTRIASRRQKRGGSETPACRSALSALLDIARRHTMALLRLLLCHLCREIQFQRPAYVKLGDERIESLPDGRRDESLRAFLFGTKAVDWRAIPEGIFSAPSSGFRLVESLYY